MRSHNTNILVTQAHVCQNSKQVKVLKFNVSEQSVVLCTQAVNVLVWSCLGVSHCALCTGEPCITLACIHCQLSSPTWTWNKQLSCWWAVHSQFVCLTCPVIKIIICIISNPVNGTNTDVNYVVSSIIDICIQFHYIIVDNVTNCLVCRYTGGSKRPQFMSVSLYQYLSQFM